MITCKFEYHQQRLAKDLEVKKKDNRRHDGFNKQFIIGGKNKITEGMMASTHRLLSWTVRIHSISSRYSNYIYIYSPSAGKTTHRGNKTPIWLTMANETCCQTSWKTCCITNLVRMPPSDSRFDGQLEMHLSMKFSYLDWLNQDDAFMLFHQSNRIKSF